MPKPILVGFDPNSGDSGPLEFGAAAARFTGATLIVATVYAHPPTAGNGSHAHMDEDLTEQADGPLDELRRGLDADEIRYEVQALAGRSAPAALHNAAESLDAGLLVVGSACHDHGGRLHLGSTADRLIHGAPCPIAVVPHRWHRGGGLNTLGVAYADTPEGHQALESGLALAQRAGAKVRVLVAVHPRDYGKAAGTGMGTQPTRSTYDDLGAQESAADAHVRATASGLAPDVEVETDISVQNAADFLIAASGNLDLLVCGSRGYGPGRAVMLGGVSRKVTAGASCPVIVLARGIETGLEELVAAGADAGA